VSDRSGLLKAPIFLDSYDRGTHVWKSAQLGEAKTRSQSMDVECLGSILSIKGVGKRLVLETHINPSAGCLLVVSSKLELETSLYGWLVGSMGEDELVYHRSEVHFAPIHSAEIAVYDLRAKRDVTIFPHKPEQAIRQARVKELAEFYKTHEEWCQKWNDPCDPEDFDSELEGDVKTNPAEQALAFVISYEQIQQYPNDDAKPSGPKEVVYVYRHVNDESKMEYREMLWSEVRERAGNVPLERLVEREMLDKIISQGQK
jgi:hypothetical protein